MTEQPNGNQPSSKAELQTIEDAVDRSDQTAPPDRETQGLTGDDVHRDPVEILADDFMERCRRGEQPSIDEYVSLNPECADQIRELFPTIAVMERLKLNKEKQSGTQAVSVPIGLERLGDLSIVGEIGRGGMGIVYEAVQESLGRRVAVKVLPKQFLLDDKRLRRFRREARTAANLHHTNIVPILGVGEHDGYHYYVMQYIRGVGLDEVVARLTARDPDSTDTDPSSSARAGEATRVANALLSGQFQPHEKSPSTGSEVAAGTSESPTDADSFQTIADRTAPSSSGRSATTIAASGVSATGESISTSEAPAPSEARPAPRFGAPYWRSLARIGYQVADALDYAHEQNVLHRDIKPANLLLDSHGVVWVADFGLAKATEQDDLSRSGDIVGTLRYMAPEQVQGDADARSDIYSLGLTLYELLTLRPAHDDAARKRSLLHKGELADPTRPRKLNPHIPRDLETIVLKAMAAEPSRRYQSAGELVADFANYLDDRPIRARRVSSAERLWRWCRRNRAVAALSGTALALLVLVAALASIGYVRAKEAKVRAEEANRLIQQALNGEREQRERAEATLEISLEALDKVASRFLPDQVAAGSLVTVEVDDGDQFDIPSLPAVSKETAAMLEDILPFYDRLAEQYGDNERLRAASAKAYRRVGDIQQRLGNPVQAAAAYQRSIEMYKNLADDGRGPSARLLDAARTCNELGNVYMAMRDIMKARASYNGALSLLKSVSASNDPSPEVRYELARTLYNLDRRPDLGLDMRRPGSPRGDRRGPRDGSRGPWGGQPGHVRIGSFSRDSGEPGSGRPGSPDGDPDRGPGGPTGGGFVRSPDGGPPRGPDGRPQWPGRWENMDNAIEILSDLIAEYPASPDYRHLLALCLREKVFGSSSDNLTKAIQMLEEICSEFPKHTNYRFDLCETLSMPAYAARMTQENIQAIEDRLRRALEIADELADEYPNEPEYAAAQLDIHFKLGSGLAHRARVAGDPESATLFEEAEEHFRSTVDIGLSLVDGFPDVTRYMFWYSFCRGLLADILSHRRQFDETHLLLDSTISELEQELKADPGKWLLYGPLIFCHRTRSHAYREMGEDDLASAAKERADELRRQLLGPGASGDGPPFRRKKSSRGGFGYRRGNEPSAQAPPTRQEEPPDDRPEEADEEASQD